MVITADATRRLSSQFRRFSCSPLEVYTFTINGPRFSVGPFFSRKSRVASGFDRPASKSQALASVL
ncbi:hypothetical protein ELG69_30710 [Rhizobium leguminosarum]|nr:hypothetical protein ELG74_29500 [Rhizobium leguminosarum]TBG74681.1 hypothetical protein ELG69_30710 [Rhizobium leguminosarum]